MSDVRAGPEPTGEDEQPEPQLELLGDDGFACEGDACAVAPLP